MEIGQIVKGHVNEFLGLNKDLSTGRLAICHKCPLYSEKYGGLCNDRLYLNEETGDLSLVWQPGFKKGCGCRLSAKTTLSNATCPLDKW